MVGRILLGERGGVSGLFVSRPGVDVATASGRDLLIDPTRKQIQVIHERILTLGEIICIDNYHVVARRVDHPDFGFLPLIRMSFISDAYYNTLVGYPKYHAAAPRTYNRDATGFYLSMYQSYRDGVMKTYAVSMSIKYYNVACESGANLALPSGSSATIQWVPDE